ncbi:hypothetical protein HXX76_010939 [Chlamydomonas incerta]|uniref:Protein kinase domain-containing protein n=1 Tax=Chlamydomonas incerta TaxID=51695 RepID=A0A835SNJ9_CHLIN|nr:hypothetical protein HXX76_010939 [Chlamydomonas incerta]|eukprot:KAG2423171.1 hypothetical protein HXX76_010939 [Chlamydomonas incerta]
MASQGLFFGGYDVWIHGPGYFINDYFVNSTCLATRAASECVAILLYEIDADRARQQQAAAAAAQQQAVDSGGGSTGSTAMVVVAVVVPAVGAVILAVALAGSIWWVRRSSRRRRELERLGQRSAKAGAAADAAGAAGDVEAAGGSCHLAVKTAAAAGGASGGGARLGVMGGGGGVKGGGGGGSGVFMGVEDEHDVPQWSEAAHLEADDFGGTEHPPYATASPPGGGGGGQWRAAPSSRRRGSADSAFNSNGGTKAAGACSAGGGSSSTADPQPPSPLLQPQHALPAAQPHAAVGPHGAAAMRLGIQQAAAAEQETPPTPGSEASSSPHAAGRGSSGICGEPSQQQDPQQTAAVSPRRMKRMSTHPAAAAAGAAARDGASLLVMSAAAAAAGKAAAAEVAAPPTRQGTADAGAAAGSDVALQKHAPSADELVTELGALVKELRGNVNHTPIVLEGVLGHGSFGTVYKGTWQGLCVAIKTVVFSASQESRKHALQEAALCQSISHPNIIATYASELQPIGVLPNSTVAGGSSPERVSPAAGVAGDTPPGSSSPQQQQRVSHLNITDWRLYIIQEFADGGPLGRLYGHPALWLSPGVANLGAVLPLALGIARALEHVHSKRIVHGDLNPNNVLLKRDPAEPSGYAVKVGDFGLSVMLPNGRTHLSNLRMGTMFYIAPEVACMGHISSSADIFSLGVILWELYHGRTAGVRAQEGPRYCSNFPAFPATCPQAYTAITLRCLQRDPGKRPEAAAAVAALEALLWAHLKGQLGST